MVLERIIELQLQFNEEFVLPLAIKYFEEQNRLQMLPNVTYEQSIAGAIYSVKKGLMEKYNIVPTGGKTNEQVNY